MELSVTLQFDIDGAAARPDYSAYMEFVIREDGLYYRWRHFDIDQQVFFNEFFPGMKAALGMPASARFARLGQGWWNIEMGQLMAYRLRPEEALERIKAFVSLYMAPRKVDYAVSDIRG